MNYPELHYPNEFDPSDPLSVINHQKVCANIREFIGKGETINAAIANAQDEQMVFDRNLYDALLGIGSNLTPLTAEGTLSKDVTKKRTFVSGMVLALNTIDTICDFLEIDRRGFRTIWQATGFIKVVDTTADTFKDKTNAEKYEAIGDGVVARGDAFLSAIDSSYVHLINEVSDNYANLTEPHIFKTSYAYVLGSAQQAFVRMFQELEARRIIDILDEDDIERGINYLVETPILTRFPSDDTIADELDTEIFFGENEDGVEAYLGEEIERQLDINGEVVETLNALALAIHPNELDNGSLDEAGEAFFNGSILALKYVERMCSRVDVDMRVAGKRWRKARAHAKLYKLEFLPEARDEVVDIHVVKTLQRSKLSFGTVSLINKISHEMDYDEDEAAAFKNGLQYALETHRTAIQGCINSRITARVELAKRSLDSELDTLLGHK